MLKVNHLKKRLMNFKIEDICFELPKGYICGLIGANGCGKSSLIKLILGMYEPEEGSVLVNGMDFNQHEAQIKQMLGVVTDENFFDMDATAAQNAKLYGGMYASFDYEKFKQYLVQFGVAADKKLKKLSKGTQMKFQLAFALSYDAKLFLFDEPTSSLDEAFRKEFLNICTKLIEDGEHSILLATHLTQDLDRAADYIVYMHEGRLVLTAAKEDLCRRFMLVKAENYKLRLLPPKALVYMEEGKYGGSALVVNSRQFALDDAYEKKQPNIEELMYYFTKGGIHHAADLYQNFM